MLLPTLLLALSPQGWFTPPPPPAGNPGSDAQALLGMALFWDEQLSSSNTVACGSCHFPTAGGSDPRTALGESRHPGPDGLLGTGDDVLGSFGLSRRLADGRLDADPVFGLGVQVTGRKAGSVINALYSPRLFWDGRAEGAFHDPVSGQLLLPIGAALESQAAGPPLSPVEMAHTSRDWSEIAAKIDAARPLVLASSIPSTLSQWIAGRRYAPLFDDAFGPGGVTAARILFAIATYQRRLLSDQTPFDDYQRGDPQALDPEELRGRDLFLGKGRCVQCHTFPLLGRTQFQYTGVRPAAEDPGRYAVSNDPNDLGRMLVPGLRNISLRAPYFRNGGAATLEAVIDFYDRGGDFDAPNKAPSVAPIGFSAGEKADLLAFLERGLLDPRVAAGAPPFDRPILASETGSGYQPVGAGTAGSGGFVPRLVLADPLLPGRRVPVGIEHGLGGAAAELWIDTAASVSGVPLRGVQVHLAMSQDLRLLASATLAGGGPGEGWACVQLDLPTDPAFLGRVYVLQWLVADSGGPQGYAATAAAQSG